MTTLTEARPREVLIRPPKPDLFTYHISLLREHREGNYTTNLSNILRERISQPDLIGIRPSIIDHALSVATDAHLGQKRDFSGGANEDLRDEYVTHPIRTALLTIELAREMGIPITERLIVASLLHDTVEDSRKEDGRPKYTRTSVREAFKSFGEDLAEQIADDSEALSHYHPETRNKLNPHEYHAKITDAGNADKETVMIRTLAKTSDRWDNLFDPPTSPEQIEADTQGRITADAFRYFRRHGLDKTTDEEGLMRQLLYNQPELLYHMYMVIYLSTLTLKNPDFNPDNLPHEILDSLGNSKL
jgi:HD domain